VDTEVEDFLEHYGVKGQKWGVRKANKAVAKAGERAKTPDRFGNRNNQDTQRRVDRVRSVASGTASTATKARVALTVNGQEFINNSFSLQATAASRLDRDARLQRSIVSGRSRVTDRLTRLSGTDIREINLSYTPPPV